MKKTIILMAMLFIALGTISVVSAQEQPLIKTTLVNYDPAPARPGDILDVWVRIENAGDREAEGISVEFMDSYPFTLFSERGRETKISVLEPGQDYLIKYTVRVDNGANPGRHQAIIKYDVDSQRAGEVISAVNIEVMTSETPIALHNVKVEPEVLKPGSKAKLTLSVKNLAKTTVVRDVAVTLRLDPVVTASSVLIDLPFVPISSGSQKTLDVLRPGQSADFEFELATYADAESRLYKMPVSLSYVDDSGISKNKSVLIGLEVNTKPEMLVAIDSSTINTENLNGEVSVVVTNRGITNIKLMTLSLKDGDNYKITSSSKEIYVGNVDSDDFETASFDIVLEEAKNTMLPVTLTYKDALNNEYTEDYELSLNVNEPTANGGAGGTVTVIVIIIIAVIAFIIYRKQKQKKRRK